MFVVELHYIAPLEEIDAHMKEHMIFLNKYYRQNVFIASGRKVPRTGGIILAIAKSKDELERIIHEDPFFVNKLAEVRITEFNTSQMHPDFKKALAGLVTD